MTEQDEVPEPFPFATLPELKERWPQMPDGIGAEAGIALLDASQFILDVAPTAAEKSPTARRRIVCAVVKRSMQAPEALTGMESVQQGAGPYQQTSRPVNPHGDFYLTRLEKKALGVGKQRGGEMDLLAGSRRVWDEHDADR